MPFPSILLTPVDASPLNAPVASGATTFGAILATVGRIVLAKKDASAPSKKISNDQELIQSDPISCPQNQKGNN